MSSAPPNKFVHVVRHGQSTYNQQRSNDSVNADAKLHDCVLTQKGQGQAQKLGGFLHTTSLKTALDLQLPVDLVLVSPLKRAIQTFLLVLEESKQSEQKIWSDSVEVLISDMLAERLEAPGDIGHYPEEIEAEFKFSQRKYPTMKLSSIPKVWWYQPTQNVPPPPDWSEESVAKYWKAFESCRQSDDYVEPQDVFVNRVKLFKDWIAEYMQKNNKKNAILFGHHDFFNAFTGEYTEVENDKGVKEKRFLGGVSLGNCELHTIEM